MKTGASRGMRGSVAGYLFLVPYLALFLVFLILPLGYGLGLSFMKYEMVSPDRTPPHFIGAANYIEAMHDAYFWQSLKATCLFVVFSVPLTIVLAMALAVGIEKVRGRRQGIYQAAVFLPAMITISVAGILWRWFYNDEFGVFNAILGHFHWHHEPLKVPWITQPHWALASIILMSLWWTIGAPTIILLAGLKQIPRTYFEAASIDGATGWRRLWFITLPLLRPVFLFVSVMCVIGAFQIFGQTFIITAGGPAHSTRVLVQYIYETAFNFFRMGYAAAISWLLFVVIVIASWIQFRIFRER